MDAVVGDAEEGRIAVVLNGRVFIEPEHFCLSIRKARVLELSCPKPKTEASSNLTEKLTRLPLNFCFLWVKKIEAIGF